MRPIPLTLLTRPEPEVHALAAVLEEAGIPALVNPLLRILPVDHAFITARPATALVFSSSKAVQYGNFPPEAFAMPVFVVGEKTAQTARLRGFVNIHTGPRDAAGLATLIAQTHTAQPQLFSELIYVRGEDVSYDLSAALQEQGFAIKEQIVYQAVPEGQFAPATLTAFAQERLRLVPFYSGRTAQIFMTLAAEAGLEKTLKTMRALCISHTVLECVRPALWYKTYTAPQPQGGAMLGLIRSTAAEILQEGC